MAHVSSSLQLFVWETGGAAKSERVCVGKLNTPSPLPLLTTLINNTLLRIDIGIFHLQSYMIYLRAISFSFLFSFMLSLESICRRRWWINREMPLYFNNITSSVTTFNIPSFLHFIYRSRTEKDIDSSFCPLIRVGKRHMCKDRH